MSFTNLYTAIKAILLADTPTQNALQDGKIWGAWPRTYATPCLVIEVDKDDEQNDLSGGSASGMLISSVTITCRGGDGEGSGDGLADAWTLWSAVRAALRGKTINGIDFVLDDTADSNMPKNEGSTLHWYDRVMSWSTTRMEAGA